MAQPFTAHTEAAPLLKQWVRHLSTRTIPEIRALWVGPALEALEQILKLAGQPSFEQQLEHHNPIYFLAQQCWFDNVVGVDGYLYAPLHRDRLCKQWLAYLLDVDPETQLPLAKIDIDIAGDVALVQRDSFKSTFSHGVIPHWWSLREKDVFGRDARIHLIHHKEQMAAANLKRIAAKAVAHPWMREVWPEFCVEDERKLGSSTQLYWPNTAAGRQAEPNIVAAGLGGSLTGFHADLRCLDDIVVEDHRASKVLRAETESKYDAYRYTLDMKRGKEIVTGTRYHVRDQYGKLKDSTVEGPNMPLPTECPYWPYCKRQKDQHKHLYHYTRIKAIEDNGELSFPTRHTYEKLEAMRQREISTTGNDTFWHLQMQNEPKTTNLIATAPNWIKMCDYDQVPLEVWRCGFVDPAWKGMANHGEGDSASLQVWAFARIGSLVLQFLLDIIHSNELTEEDGINEIFRLSRIHAVTDWAPEERGGYSFRTRLENEGVSRGWPLRIINLESMQAGKEQRILAFLGAMQAGRVFLCKEARDLGKFLDEFEDYPQVDHDDALDCAGYTADPAIMKNFAPRAPVRSPWQRRREKQEPPRTRHCLG